MDKDKTLSVKGIPPTQVIKQLLMSSAEPLLLVLINLKTTLSLHRATSYKAVTSFITFTCLHWTPSWMQKSSWLWLISSFHSDRAHIQLCPTLTMTGALSTSVQHTRLYTPAQCHSRHLLDTIPLWGGGTAEKKGCMDVFTSWAVGIVVEW